MSNDTLNFSKILLHICCAPCACYVTKYLIENGYEPTLFFYNPNIHPYSEYLKRLESARDFAIQKNLPLVEYGEYDIRKFLRNIEWEKESPYRCFTCYRDRLTATGKYAEENNFDNFTSTLFYSVYQPQEIMRKIGESISDRFIYFDFREGWQEGIRISKEIGLYRQKYCGCIFSEYDRYSKLKKSNK